MRVSKEQVNAAIEALLDFDLDGVVGGAAGVVAIDGDILKSWIGLQKLCRSYGFSADGARRGNLPEIRICDLGQQRRTLGELCSRKLVQVKVWNPHVDDVRTHVGNFERQMARDLSLDCDVPLLRIA